MFKSMATEIKSKDFESVILHGFGMDGLIDLWTAGQMDGRPFG